MRLDYFSFVTKLGQFREFIRNGSVAKIANATIEDFESNANVSEGSDASVAILASYSQKLCSEKLN